MASTRIITPEFRVSYPYVFKTGKPMQEGGVAKFSVTMLFKKGEKLDELRAMAEAAVREKWGSDPTKWPKNLRTPFRDQGEKGTEGYEEGAIFINATSKQKPELVDRRGIPITEEHQFYAGCYARASVSAFAYDQSGNRGVSFGLGNIQKLRDGDSLSGRTRAADDFEPLPDIEDGAVSAFAA